MGMRIRDVLGKLFPGPDQVSAAWLKEQARLSSRIDFHGVRIQFPINKRRNESAQWNRHRLKAS